MFLEHKKQRINRENPRKGWVIVCFNFFEEITLNPFLDPTPCLPHFESVLNDLKHYGCTNYWFYQISLYSKNKDAMIKF
jgi:hypothetical protein